MGCFLRRCKSIIGKENDRFFDPKKRWFILWRYSASPNTTTLARRNDLIFRAERTRISGPTPAGSPMVTPIRGFILAVYIIRRYDGNQLSGLFINPNVTRSCV